MAQSYSTPSIAEMIKAKKDQTQIDLNQSENQLRLTQDQYREHHEDYISGRRNPIADLIKAPQRDINTEERQKQVAKWGLIGDAIELIGKGYAASKGVKPSGGEGESTYRAIGELQRLDDIYRQEGYRYDHQVMLDGLRRKEAQDNLQDRQLQEARIDYENNRAKAEKADQAELGYKMSMDDINRNRAEKLADRAQKDKRDSKRFSEQVYLSGRGGGNTNDSNPLLPDTKVKGLYSVPFFGRNIPMTPTLQQEIADYMESRRDPNDFSQEEFKWSNVSRDPNLQNQVGKALEDMKLNIHTGKLTGDQIVSNSISKSLIPKLYQAKESNERINMVARVLQSPKISDTSKVEWLENNSQTLAEMGLEFQ